MRYKVKYKVTYGPNRIEDWIKLGFATKLNDDRIYLRIHSVPLNWDGTLVLYPPDEKESNESDSNPMD